MENNKLQIRFGTEAGIMDTRKEMVTLWVNDTRFDGELMSLTLPFYDTRFALVKEKLIKKLVKHLVHNELDLTPTEK